MSDPVFRIDPSGLKGFRLAVVGGGVLGLSAALLAARSGAKVRLFDPRPLGRNASGVAAGMLAPGLEAALDAQEADLALLEEGLRAWAPFAGALALDGTQALHAGALYLDTPEALAPIADRLTRLGVGFERIGEGAARALQPALGPGWSEALRVRADGRIDPLRMLAAMARRFQDAGGEIVFEGCDEPPGGVDAVVLAAGHQARAWRAYAPELAALAPIKGHVLHFDRGPTHGPTLRTRAGYAAPQAAGVVFGATMEMGRDDEDIDADTVASLREAAIRLLPELERASFTARTGVRAATPSGRPMVGRSSGGLVLAVGARRNGWLLAPLVAQTLVEVLMGGHARFEFSPPA